MCCYKHYHDNAVEVFEALWDNVHEYVCLRNSFWITVCFSPGTPAHFRIDVTKTVAQPLLQASLILFAAKTLLRLKF
jgi:hypothetical protein